MKWLYDISYGHSVFDLLLPDVLPAPLFIYFHGGGFERGDKQCLGELANRFAEQGIAFATANYRMYPDGARFPDYLEDAAECVHFLMEHQAEYGGFTEYYVGGTSAGAYQGMMLYFDKHYLGRYGIDSESIRGYIFDSGQPTTHFNVLKERGEDPRRILVDEAAPLYFLTREVDPERTPRFLFIEAGDDMPCRPEQNAMLRRTMLRFGYSPAKIDYRVIPGYKHCKYIQDPFFIEMMIRFIKG